MSVSSLTASVVLVMALAAPAVGQTKAKSVPVTGAAVPELTALDEILVDFLREHKVPGATVAVAKEGRLVYCRGFGFADLDQKVSVKPASLFRIASISKTITAAAVYRLIEDGKLSPEDKVYDLLRLKADPKGKFDSRWKDVTVKHLLEHKGGWDREQSGDPMFKSVSIAKAFGVAPPAGQQHIIAYMLGQPLDFAPGTKRVYSNFGYCLLGRVIEKAGAKPYDKYVQEALLKPLGIRDTQLGKTLAAAKGEVRYYDSKGATGNGVFTPLLGKRVPAPYGAWCLEAMDAHGGWLSTAADLARFGSAFDQPNRFPAYKGAAFKGRFGPDYFHTGGLAGTSTILRRAPNGITWVVLFNANKASNGKDLVDELSPRFQQALEKVADWPKDDLFQAMKYDVLPKTK